jgi:hypothetical protein
VVSFAGIYKYKKKSLLEFIESTSSPRSPAPSSESWCWRAVSARRIFGPVFFNETINCERYVQVILGQFFPELIEEEEEERLYFWFQQDSATAHTVRMSKQALSNVFRVRIINSDIWPARSTELNPCDFFFWVV